VEETVGCDDAEIAEVVVESPTASGSGLATTVIVWSHPFAVPKEIWSRDGGVHDLSIPVEEENLFSVLIRLNTCSESGIIVHVSPFRLVFGVKTPIGGKSVENDFEDIGSP